MYFNGLPEMKISNVNITNTTILGAKSGIVINQTDGVKIENCRIEPLKGSVIRLADAENISIDGLKTSTSSASALVESGCSSITIKESDIDKENVTFAEGVSSKTVKFK